LARWPSFLFLKVSLLLCTGCAQLVKFQVLDGETKQPIPNASVGLEYDPFTFTGSTDGKTNSDGIVRLWAYPSRGAGVWTSAQGYLRNGGFPHSISERDVEHGKTVTIWLLAEPTPEVVLVVPKGFRGTFTVEEQAWPDALPQTPHKRYYEFPVRDGCAINLTGIPTGHSANEPDWGGRGSADFRAIYDDGSPLLGGGAKVYDSQGQRRPVPDRDQIAVRCVEQILLDEKSVGVQRFTYIVGTEADAADYRKDHGLPSRALKPRQD
jgi:hypothetical protein